MLFVVGPFLPLQIVGDVTIGEVVSNRELVKNSMIHLGVNTRTERKREAPGDDEISVVAQNGI
jgi:hypothetical protein